MRPASLALLASTLLVASGVAQEPVLPDAAFAADDACAAGEGGEACEISLRQLRGQKVASESDHDEEAQPAMFLTSSFSEGEGDALLSHCQGTPLARSPKTLYSEYAEKDDGAQWRTSSTVIPVVAQKKKLFGLLFPYEHVGLRLDLNYEANSQKTRIRVGALSAPVPRDLDSGDTQCQPSFCRLVKPECRREAAQKAAVPADSAEGDSDGDQEELWADPAEEAQEPEEEEEESEEPVKEAQESCSPESPVCGWAELDAFVDQPLNGTAVSFNVTGLINANHSAVQVFVVPEGMDEEGFWRTPEVTVLSWRFFNLGTADGAGEDSA